MAYKLLSSAMTKWNFYTIKYSVNLAQISSRCMSSSSSGANIGFIGLGNMGKRMAVNLMKKVRTRKLEDNNNDVSERENEKKTHSMP